MAAISSSQATATATYANQPNGYDQDAGWDHGEEHAEVRESSGQDTRRFDRTAAN